MINHVIDTAKIWFDALLRVGKPVYVRNVCAQKVVGSFPTGYLDATGTPAFLLLLLCATVAAGCGYKSAAPSAPVPQTLSSMTRDRTSYTFLKWDQGLAIMLVDWCDGHSMSSSSGNGELDQRNGDGHWWDKVSAEWKEGYEWQLATSNGQIGRITINDVQYDLAKGAVFRIDTGDDGATVTQINRDLSDIQANRNSCDRFITSTPELRKSSVGSRTE